MNIINLKRASIAGIALLSLSTSHAEGYQVNTLSSRQLGMAHTGVALKLGSESQFFNPAGLAFMTDMVDASASFNAILPTAKATIDGKTHTTDNNPSTPFSVFGAFNVSNAVNVGLSLYTPYGSGINWTDNWPGATLNQSVKLAAFTVQPSVAWKITPRLGVGAGLTVSWGNVDLHKGLINGPTFDAMIGLLQMAGQLPAGLPTFGEITPASVALTGKSSLAVGFNVGAMYDINDHFTVGADYRSKSNMKVKAGQTEVSYATADPTLLAILSSKLGGISKTDFSAEMPLPAVLSFGGSWHNDKVTAALDAQLTFWNTYKYLDISFEGAPEFNQHLEKNYRNSWLFKAGVQWNVINPLYLRAGLAVDMSPCNKDFYNPETPGMTKIEPTLGLAYRPTSHLGVNAAVMYVAGLGENNASYTTTNVLTQQPDKFTADYKVKSWIASVGISLSF